MDTEQRNREINQFEGFQLENSCFKQMHGYRMENIVTFSIAYITLSESFQTMPVGICEG